MALIALQGLLLVAGVYGLGLTLLAGLRRLDPAGDRRSELDPVEAAVALGLGLWLLSVLALVLGLGGGLRPGLLGAVLAAGSVVALWRGRVRWRRGGSPGLGGCDRLLLAVCGLGALAASARALVPPTAWDGIAYHLALARHFAAHGGFVDFPTLRQARWPQGIDALFAVSEALGGTALSELMVGFLGLVSVAAAAALGGRLGGARTAVVTAALFAGAPVVGFLQGIPYVESGLAALVALALAAALGHAATGRRSDLAAAALLAGAAAAVKYSALVYPLLTALVLLWLTRRWRPALVFAAVAAAAAAPWYLRTLVLTGNPVWPYLYGWLGGSDWSLAQAGRLAAFERGYGSGLGAVDVLLSPFRLVFAERRFDGLLLGPAFLALAPLAVIRADRFRLGLAGFGLAGFAAWLALTQQIRFLVPLLPVIAAAIAGGIASRAWPRTAAAGRAIVLVTAATSLVLALGGLAERWGVLTGREPRDDYLARMIDSYPAMRFVDTRLRPRRLLLFREVRGYYLDTPYLWGDPRAQAVIDYAAMADPGALYRRLAELGVDAVLVDRNQYPPSSGYYDQRTLALMAGMLEEHGRVVFDQGGVEVYSLEAAPAPSSGAER